MDYGPCQKKRIFGVEIGEVVELEKGGARVKVLFSAWGDNCVSNWAPVVIPLAGSGMGTYFMPCIYDKVLVMFHQGDVNSPFVIKSIWTEERRPPTTEENQESDRNKDAKNNLRYIKSASGHLLIMDDTKDKEKIQIIDKTVNNRIEINNNKEAKENQTNFITNEGNINIKALKGKVTIECKEFCISASKSINIQSEGTLELKATKDMTIISNENLKVKGNRIENKADVNMLSQGGANVELKGGQVQMESGGGLKRIAARIQEVKGTQVQIGMGGSPMAPMAVTAAAAVAVTGQKEEAREEKEETKFISSARWSKSKARCGDEITLSCSTKSFPDGTQVTFKIYEKDTKGEDDYITTLLGNVKENRVEAKWKYEYHEDIDDVDSDKEQKEKGYTKPEYYFKVKIEDKESKSGIVEFKDWIELECVDEEDNPLANEKFVLVSSDGKRVEGQLNEKGFAKVSNLPPAKKWEVEFPD